MSWICHVNLPGATDNQIAVSEYDVFNLLFKGLLLADDNDLDELAIQCIVALSMWVPVTKGPAAIDEKKGPSHAVSGLLQSLEAFMPFYSAVVAIMIAESSFYQNRDAIDEDAKLACLRLTKHVIFRSNFAAQVSVRAGFAEEEVM